MDYLKQIFENNFLMSLLSAIGGGIIVYLRNRLRTLEYSVSHQGIAFAYNDPIIGSIQVSWGNKPVTNLYMSKVELKNNTNRDYKNLIFKTYTLDTLLLSEKTEIVGTTQIAQWSPAFKQALLVPSNSSPTQLQLDTYNKSREYQIPVLNRGQKISLTYLTSVPQGNAGPAIWLETIYEGVKVNYRPPGPEVLGVPLKIAIYLGIIICLLTFLMCIFFVSDVKIVALISILVGLFAQPLGAILFQGYRLVKSLLIG